MDRRKRKKAISDINYILKENNSCYRLCSECGKVITDGYYEDDAYACSDECGAKVEKVSLGEFRKARRNCTDRELQDWEYGYWTTWV